MIIVHIESGLGNQMLDYCDYLACKYANPNEKIYIENAIFEIKDCETSISMWNGYELQNLFNIDVPNISELIGESQWNSIIENIKLSKFWEDDWRYSDAFTNAMEINGYNLKNYIHRKSCNKTKKRFKNCIKSTQWFHYIQLIMVSTGKINCTSLNKSASSYRKINEDAFTGHFLQFMYKGSEIEKIENEIRETFVFPTLLEDKNTKIANIISNSESVAIHVRRGDFLNQNKFYYKNGYFKRAINFIKKEVNTPVFVIFCDKDTVFWVEHNFDILGLKKQDEVYFVNWNYGDKSYIDMQLMSMCKHNVITNSSFGWWGAFLNNNPNKITCSPHWAINTTHWF